MGNLKSKISTSSTARSDKSNFSADIKKINLLNADYSKLHEIKTQIDGNTYRIYLYDIIPFVIPDPTTYIIISPDTSDNIMDIHSFATKIADRYNIGVIVYDYIGYGQTKKIYRASERLCYLSFKCIMNYLFDKGIDTSNIILLGKTLGANIVLDYASDHLWSAPMIIILPDFFDKFNKISSPIKLILHKTKNNENYHKKIYNKIFEPVLITETDENFLNLIDIGCFDEVIKYAKLSD